jgi:hypothetical protein
MDPGVGCSLTHVSKTRRGKSVKRVFCGDAGDWGAGDPDYVCNDCNAGFGQPHHPGCDTERCPSCGGQMLGCLGPIDEFGGCGWLYLAELKPTGVMEAWENRKEGTPS